MMWARAAKFLAAILLVGLAVWGMSGAYRAYADRWPGDLRAPLILGSLAGIAFIVIGSCAVYRCDRRGEAARGRDSLGR